VTAATTATTSSVPSVPAQLESSKGISESQRYACVVCGHHFCLDCDLFAHEVIHNCPGCQGDARAAEAGAMQSDGPQVGAANGVDGGHTNGDGSMIIDS